ncbi:hypothetical protein GCM10011405_10640 [Rufibacter glacialis]|nr:hypothetical protein GCM10011405_10640 [Rufibacter glacialis]
MRAKLHSFTVDDIKRINSNKNPLTLALSQRERELYLSVIWLISREKPENGKAPDEI